MDSSDDHQVFPVFKRESKQSRSFLDVAAVAEAVAELTVDENSVADAAQQQHVYVPDFDQIAARGQVRCGSTLRSRRPLALQQTLPNADACHRAQCRALLRIFAAVGRSCAPWSPLFPVIPGRQLLRASRRAGPDPSGRSLLRGRSEGPLVYQARQRTLPSSDASRQSGSIPAGGKRGPPSSLSPGAVSGRLHLRPRGRERSRGGCARLRA